MPRCFWFRHNSIMMLKFLKNSRLNPQLSTGGGIPWRQYEKQEYSDSFPIQGKSQNVLIFSLRLSILRVLPWHHLFHKSCKFINQLISLEEDLSKAHQLWQEGLEAQRKLFRHRERKNQWQFNSFQLLYLFKAPYIPSYVTDFSEFFKKNSRKESQLSHPIFWLRFYFYSIAFLATETR